MTAVPGTVARECPMFGSVAETENDGADSPTLTGCGSPVPADSDAV